MSIGRTLLRSKNNKLIISKSKENKIYKHKYLQIIIALVLISLFLFLDLYKIREM